MSRTDRFAELAARSMQKRCGGNGPCPLSIQTTSTQKLVEDDGFKLSVLKACARMNCEEKMLAVLAVNCEK